ncbi:MAG: DNA cytosine methyltransferase, partial [Sulfurimonas sp.]|uniref:DNA cytosine methyltransferase n=1 Tax=Sulfurimonas sp. TaxID=2022749 RepID=UPI0028CE2ED3
MIGRTFSLNETAEILSISKETLRRWDNSGKLKSVRNPINNYREYKQNDLIIFENAKIHFDTKSYTNISPTKTYKSIELFAGAGGLALGLEKAGIQHALLNEIDKYAVQTLQKNRPNWK